MSNFRLSHNTLLLHSHHCSVTTPLRLCEKGGFYLGVGCVITYYNLSKQLLALEVVDVNIHLQSMHSLQIFRNMLMAFLTSPHSFYLIQSVIGGT